MVTAYSTGWEGERSPTLRAFQCNLFRVLRMDVRLTSEQSAHCAEEFRTLERVGLEPDRSQLLPWLPAVDSYDLQQASRSVEEPLLRLKQQLFWFDPADDHIGLQLALAELDGAALRRFLECDQKGDSQGLAEEINRANLGILLRAASMNRLFDIGEGPYVSSCLTVFPVDKWQMKKGFRFLEQAHDLLPDPEPQYDGEQWGDAIDRWRKILEAPPFRDYLETCIAALADDSVSADDAVVVLESVRVELSELLAAETRYQILQGRFEEAGELLRAMKRLGLSDRQLKIAIRGLRQLLQAEIDELAPLLQVSGNRQWNSLLGYLRRLAMIRKRWLILNPEDIVGTSGLADDCVSKALARVSELTGGEDDYDHKRALLSLDLMLETANAESVRNGIQRSRQQLVERGDGLCLFCGTERPDAKTPVVLFASRIEVEGDHLLSKWKIYIGDKTMRRCGRCAELHGFIGNVRMASVMWCFTTLAIYCVLSGEALGLLLLPLAPLWVARFVGGLFIRIATPPGHRKRGEWQHYPGAMVLWNAGFEIAPDWGKSAGAKLKPAPIDLEVDEECAAESQLEWANE